MKNKILITVMFLIVSLCSSKAQGPMKEVFSAGGDTYFAPEGMNLVLNWNIGDPIIGTYFYDSNNKLIDSENLFQDNYNLSQNYPNPFNIKTSIDFYLPDKANIKLSLFDLLGREIKIIKEGSYDAGKYSVSLEKMGLSEGLYVYGFIAKGENSEFKTSKMMIVSQ